MTPLFVENALVIGMTKARDVTAGGHVLVEDGVITALHGDAERRAREIAAAGRPLERLDARGLWLLTQSGVGALPSLSGRWWPTAIPVRESACG